MSLTPNPPPGGLEQLAELEKAVLGRVSAAAEELQRVESLDDEQRAEIHAILEAIRHESESSAAFLPGWGTYVPAGRPAGARRSDLGQHFAEMHKTILAAAEEFARQARAAPDPGMRLHLQRLVREELRHAELVERLLEIVNE
jgi:hypothetical protein